MVVKYEQKFISGIDPTIAWMDIVSNATSFGTSNSTNYGLSSNFANNINRWTGKNGISSLINEIIGAITESFEEIKSKVVNLVNNIIEGNAEAGLDAITDAAGNAGGLFDAISDSISKTIQKYRVQLLGITHALSGLPSTPWHITVGNPLRPIFCSGDMYTDRVNLKLGPTLSFNDLPSDITVEFTLTNARPLGLQEILAKFNTGYLRTINTRKDYLSDISTPPNGDGEYVDGGGYFFNTEDNVNQVENVTGTEVISSQTTNTNTTTTSNGATNNLPVGIGALTDSDSVGPTLPPSQNGASTKETDL
jgi:hypothetical protein